MAEFWKPVMKRLWPWSDRPYGEESEAGENPQVGDSPTETVAPPDKTDCHPRTFQRSQSGDMMEMPEVFDPALKQFARAMRRGEPVFRDQQVARAWRGAPPGCASSAACRQ